MAQILFVVLATVAIAAALGMLLSRNPVASALWLVLDLFCIAGLYLTLNAQFIAVVQVLVYAGAIMVLFLFVIMLLNLTALPRLPHFDWRRLVGFLAGMAILVQLVYVLAAGLGALPVELSAEQTSATGSAQEIAAELFTRFAMPLEMIGVLLLAATIGAVILAKRRLT
jgi:NADH-quinone oxidoreductase subunit J